MRIKKNDTIQIMSGKDQGKSGKVLKVFPDQGRVLVDGLNMVKKHVRPRKQGQKGEVISIPRPLNVSNVLLMCSSCGRGVRIGVREESGTKIRFCRKCKKTL